MHSILCRTLIYREMEENRESFLLTMFCGYAGMFAVF